jgi:protoporphyrinogen oxidase
VCASKKAIEPDFYWMNLADRDRAACGIFLLNSLNPTIGAPDDSCVNFVTHLNSHKRPFFAKPEDEILQAYFEDFRAVFGFDLDPFWVKLSRVPMYSPIITPNYRNPPVRSTRFGNVYFAGNYRTFPSVVSTGTALASGLEAAQAILSDIRASDTWQVAAFSRVCIRTDICRNCRVRRSSYSPDAANQSNVDCLLPIRSPRIAVEAAA